MSYIKNGDFILDKGDLWPQNDNLEERKNDLLQTDYSLLRAYQTSIFNEERDSLLGANNKIIIEQQHFSFADYEDEETQEDFTRLAKIMDFIKTQYFEKLDIEKKDQLQEPELAKYDLLQTQFDFGDIHCEQDQLKS